jgi:hypothetical protein
MAYDRALARCFLAMVLAGCGGRSDIDLPTEEDVVTVGPTTGAGTGAGGSGGAPIECMDRSFAGEQEGAVRMVADDGHAFWTTVSNHVESGDLRTGEVAELAGPLPSFIGAIGLSEQHVYLGTYGELLRMPKPGGSIESLALLPLSPVDMETDGDEVFILHYGSLGTGAVYTWSPPLGLQLLFEGFDLPTSMALDESYVYVAAQGYLLAGNFVFEGAVLRVDRVTGAAEVVIADLVDPFGLCQKGQTLYVGEWYGDPFVIDARILSAPKSGGAPALVGRISETALPLGLACDETHAYVTVPDFSPQNSAISQLVGVPLAGGSATTLVGPENAFFSEPAVNATHVAFTVQNGQTGNPPPTGVEANARAICK